MYYEAKDESCKHCGCAPETHVGYRDGKPPHCTALGRPHDLYELRSNGHVFKAPTYDAVQYTNCDKCGEQFGARETQTCPKN